MIFDVACRAVLLQNIFTNKTIIYDTSYKWLYRRFYITFSLDYNLIYHMKKTYFQYILTNIFFSTYKINIYNEKIGFYIFLLLLFLYLYFLGKIRQIIFFGVFFF